MARPHTANSLEHQLMARRGIFVTRDGAADTATLSSNSSLHRCGIFVTRDGAAATATLSVEHQLIAAPRNFCHPPWRVELRRHLVT